MVFREVGAPKAERKFCCERFYTFTDRIISVDEDGKASEWGSSDNYVTWEEREEGLDFVFCPYCGSKLLSSEYEGRD